MSKPVLGRGLGNLLNGHGTETNPEPISSLRVGDPAVGRGLRTLIKGNQQSGTLGEFALQTAGASAMSGANIPAWYFFALDLLLLAFVTLTILTNSPLEPLQGFVCAVSIGLGAVLFYIPFSRSYRAATRRATGSGDAGPKWIVTLSSEEQNNGRRFVVHLHPPIFVGEVIEGHEGRPIVRPLGIEGESKLPDTLVEQFKREAERILS
jgi:hypothetical protein